MKLIKLTKAQLHYKCVITPTNDSKNKKYGNPFHSSHTTVTGIYFVDKNLRLILMVFHWASSNFIGSLNESQTKVSKPSEKTLSKLGCQFITRKKSAFEDFGLSHSIKFNFVNRNSNLIVTPDMSFAILHFKPVLCYIEI
uniref:CSON009337 protein n=1 Tax=Culicoides sonorensis TaxID=179676 RepID=A0A336KEH0_CULSO